MALGWLKQFYGSRAKVVSAGNRPADAVHPLAIQVMADVGIDISGETPKHVDQFLDQTFDRVITVCDSAAEACPVFPGKAARYHRDFSDPAKAEGTEQERLAVFRKVRDQVKDWLDGISNDSPVLDVD
jgi:arsenate reductase (thioredoxin)